MMIRIFEAMILFSMTSGTSFAAISFLNFVTKIIFPYAYIVPTIVIEIMAVGLGLWAAGLSMKYQRPA